jgi:hypothetical protein
VIRRDKLWVTCTHSKTVGTVPGDEFRVRLHWVRCAFSDRNLQSRMPLDPTHVRLKLLHAWDQWHSSRASTALTT